MLFTAKFMFNLSQKTEERWIDAQSEERDTEFQGHESEF